VWTASGVKNKVISEVLRKYDVCVGVKQDYISENTPPRYISTNLETEISCTYIGSKHKHK